jgi:hypothetical protein
MAESFSDQPIDTAVQSCPHQPPSKPRFWIEIELIGEDEQPIPWEEYKVLLPEGKEVPGFLDGDGYARLDGLTSSGTCQIRFPNLDQDAWEKVATLAEREKSA